MKAMTTLQTETFLSYMRDVSRCEYALRELRLMWRMIESSARMNCPPKAAAIIPIIGTARTGLDKLEHDLVFSMVNEKVSSIFSEITVKAQYVIDIVVRNLYERTADIGFLATDGKLCAFAAGIGDSSEEILARLQAYQRKYTVYHDILLIAPGGEILLRLGNGPAKQEDVDLLVSRTLATDDYVEIFREGFLCAEGKPALTYSRQMQHPETGETVGILCLCFDFESEMRDIFATYGSAENHAIMMLLDGENRVIATSDSRWIPLGVPVPASREAHLAPVMFGGRLYFSRTVKAMGYQGYMGPPGWQGQVMIPLDIAFSSENTGILSGMDPVLADGLLSHAETFSPPLHHIMNTAETISRVVWNGQIIVSGQQGEVQILKSLLDQIKETGNLSGELFNRFIHELYETVLSATMHTTDYAARLLVDLLDRNLYERANDCRWWALTPALRETLSTAEKPPEALGEINRILSCIHSLYTVYTSLVVYDDSGRIIAGSFRESAEESVLSAMAGVFSEAEEKDGTIGTFIEPAMLEQVLALPDEQSYCVSAFVPDALYGGRPTYVYHAAIRHPEDADTIVGGIGIVFDAAIEFPAMLDAAISDRKNGSAFFIDRNGRILASTDSSYPPGMSLDIPPSLLAMPNGSSESRIILHENQYAIMGCAVSSGYREFKVSDGYREDILSVVIEVYGEKRESTGICGNRSSVIKEKGVPTGNAGVEFATFFIEQELFALAGCSVVEAVPACRITPVSVVAGKTCIGMLSIGQDVIWVFDLFHLLYERRSTVGSHHQVIVVQHDGMRIGLLVHQLHSVPAFCESDIIRAPFERADEKTLVSHLIKVNSGDLLVQVIDLEALFDKLMPEKQSAREPVLL